VGRRASIDFPLLAGLSAIAWSTLPQRGKDMIVVSNGKSDELFEKEIIPIVRDRAFFLNYGSSAPWADADSSIVPFEVPPQRSPNSEVQAPEAIQLWPSYHQQRYEPKGPSFDARRACT
jgi:hypothetical protein